MQPVPSTSELAALQASSSAEPAAGEHPPPSRKGIIALCLMSMAHGYSLSAFFSYAGFLTVDLGWAPDVDHSGTVVGMLGTMLPLARLPVSAVWGVVADRYGRRVCLISSALSLALGQLIFPFTTALWLALSVRFLLLGMGNCWPTLLGVVCAEMGGAQRQATILGYVIGAGGVIGLAGPAIGGSFYRIAGPTYPALVPCLIGAVLSTAAAVMQILFLPETRPRTPSADATALPPLCSNGEQPTHGAAARTAGSERGASGGAGRKECSLALVLRSPPLPRLVILRCLLGFMGFCQMALIPLWAIASRAAGGLALDNRQLGLLLSVSAGIGLIYTTFVMARLINRIGIWRALMCASLLLVVLFALIPHTVGSPFVVSVALQSLLNMTTTTAFTCTISAVNNVCARFPHRRASVNGVMVTLESGAKALGPAVGAPMYAWAIAHLRDRLPPGSPNASIISFACFAGIYAAVAVLTAFLPRDINQPYASEGAAPPPATDAEMPRALDAPAAAPAAAQSTAAGEGFAGAACEKAGGTRVKVKAGPSGSRAERALRAKWARRPGRSNSAYSQFDRDL